MGKLANGADLVRVEVRNVGGDKEITVVTRKDDKVKVERRTVSRSAKGRDFVGEFADRFPDLGIVVPS